MPELEERDQRSNLLFFSKKKNSSTASKSKKKFATKSIRAKAKRKNRTRLWARKKIRAKVELPNPPEISNSPSLRMTANQPKQRYFYND